MAAIAAGLILITPRVMENGFNFGAAKQSKVAQENSMARSMEKMPASASDNAAMSPESAKLAPDNNPMMLMEVQYMPVFQKREAEKGFNPKFNTPWQNSKSKTYSATVEGKGQEAQEEGIATVVVKDVKTNNKWIFELAENETKQFTPKAVKWIDDENLLVIVGLGYGTVDVGGELYILNINDGSVRKADLENKLNLDKYSQVTKIVSIKPLQTGEQEVTVEVHIYKDDMFNENRTETRTLTIS
jgi:hypothetical protein